MSYRKQRHSKNTTHVSDIGQGKADAVIAEQNVMDESQGRRRTVTKITIGCVSMRSGG